MTQQDHQAQLQPLQAHQQSLRQCTQCPEMLGPPVHGTAVKSNVMLIGQAPGDREIVLLKPFAWTAGKTLFRWLSSINLEESKFRNQVYMSAVCRCFPGKKPRGGDRVPSRLEIETCAQWLNAEINLLQPQLIIPVGKLAISQFLTFKTLKEVIGVEHQLSVADRRLDLIPVPHPSGASTWHVTEPGKTLLQQSLKLIAQHPAIKQL